MQPIHIGIQGFGRIGRAITRLVEGSAEFSDFQVMAINAPDKTDKQINRAYRRDSVYGAVPDDIADCFQPVRVQQAVMDGSQKVSKMLPDFTHVRHDGTSELDIGNGHIAVFDARNPGNVCWGAAGVELVIESSGAFTSRQKCKPHLLDPRVRGVLLSAPAKGDLPDGTLDIDGTFLWGINHEGVYTLPLNTVISGASCTTTCLAPVVMAMLLGGINIISGFCNSIHARTASQSLVDDYNKKSERLARDAAENIIPASTGAAKAIGLVIPQMKGKLDGYSRRVNTPDGSLVDFTFLTDRDVTVQEVNAALKAYADANPLLARYDDSDELVSTDVIGVTVAAVFDAPQTKVTGGRLVSVSAWYDNEMGYAAHLLRLARAYALHNRELATR